MDKIVAAVAFIVALSGWVFVLEVLPTKFLDETDGLLHMALSTLVAFVLIGGSYKAASLARKKYLEGREG